MGILDTVMKLFGGKAGSALGGLGGKELSTVVTALIGEGGSKLPALLEKFKAAGLGNLVQSWIGKGASLPVSGDQVKSVVGSDAISGIASKLGISSDQMASKIATLLPQLIDKLTPDGAVPDAEGLAKKLTGLLK